MAMEDTKMNMAMEDTEKALEVALLVLEHHTDMEKALVMGINMDIQTDGKIRMRTGQRQVAEAAGRMNDGNTSIIRKATMRL